MNHFRRHHARIVALLALAAGAFMACNLGLAADEVTEATAADEFRRAFSRDMTREKHVAQLKKIAEKYSDTTWADDALWCLTRVDMRSGDDQELLEHGRSLLNRNRLPHLQSFTRCTPYYQNTRLPGVLWVLERTGHRFRRPEKGRRALVFNALPMVLKADMARAAERLGRYSKAIDYYEEAIARAPDGCVFEQSYQSAIERLKKKEQRAKENSGADGAGPPAEKADTGGDAAATEPKQAADASSAGAASDE